MRGSVTNYRALAEPLLRLLRSPSILNAKRILIASVLSAALVISGCATCPGKRSWRAVGDDKIVEEFMCSPSQLSTAIRHIFEREGKLLSENASETIVGIVDERRVWIRIEELGTEKVRMTVQARSKHGAADLEMATYIQSHVARQKALCR